ncbi:hypothetical protein [Streptomyces sp. NPDC005078]|uniref:hypothetical protein n=1 Tax=unclassified Streptomyces TaxID=2593676 RepID=UPI0033B1951F
MSLLTTVIKLRAAKAEHALPLSRVRHHHLSHRPLIVIPLNRSGETASPLALMLGTHQDRPHLLVAPPRGTNSDLLNDAAAVINTYIQGFQQEIETRPATAKRPAQELYTDAPQILVPNATSAQYLQLLGRALRFRPPPDGIDPTLSAPRLGQWLTYFSERREYPGSALMLALTDLLATHWATGQSPMEDTNLAAILAWIDPPPHTTGLRAALDADNPLLHRPAGPTTDPSFDSIELDRIFKDFDTARASGNTQAQEHHLADLRQTLHAYLRPTWNNAWTALSLLQGLPQTPGANKRWTTDKIQFTQQSRYIDDGGRPQPIHDHAVQAARRLGQLEQAAAAFEAERALEDPFALAERHTTGEAFTGTVVETDPDHTALTDKGNLTLRPRFTLHTTDPLRLEPGHTLVTPANTRRRYEICESTPEPGGTRIVMQSNTHNGTLRNPNREAIPDLGAEMCFTTAPEYFQQPQFPTRENTPWTHGGPPDDPAGSHPAEEDA